MSKIKRVFLSFILPLAFVLCFSSSFAYAQAPKDVVANGACDASGTVSCDVNTANTSLNTTITNVINVLSVVVGIVAVVMIIVAGFRYVTSGGNEQTIGGAKKTFTYALVGLVLAVLAQAIARFVLDKVG